MKILLFGEYSNVHHTLCLALRRQGHEVLLISDGDGWKNYPRDIDLRRKINGPLGSLLYLTKLFYLLPKLRGYDVVQLINPIFLDVKPRWNRWIAAYLKRHNRVLSLGCMGDDYQVIKQMRDPDFLDYTDFHVNGKTLDHSLNRQRIATWNEEKHRRECSQYICSIASSLLAGLYEYYKAYDVAAYRDKLYYLPMPVMSSTSIERHNESQKVRVLIAVQKKRAQAKGTDQIEPLLVRLATEHPDRIDLHRIESVPFEQYCREVDEADVIVDQLYSYTPAMGALESMSHGKIVISGYEPAFADFLRLQSGEGTSDEITPGILNLRPFEDEANYRLLEETLLDRQKIARLSADSQAYVQKYHNADDVARKCVAIWESLIEKRQS